MTPEERTVVLQAVLQYDVEQTFSKFTTPGERHIPCPTSWLDKRTKLGSSDEVSSHNWARLSPEEKLRVWLEAPDSDYEFARDKTHIMQPKGTNLR